MELNHPSGEPTAPRSKPNSILSRLSNGVRAAALITLSAVSGGEHSASSQEPQRISRAKEAGAASDIECAASTVYVTDARAPFDISVSHATGGKSPVLSLREGASLRALQRVGASDDGAKAFASYRIEPPKGGWTVKDNGEYEIVCDSKAVSRFTVNIEDKPQANHSVRVVSISNAGSGARVRLSVKGAAEDAVDARGLMRSGIVLRCMGTADIPLQLQPSRDLDDAEEIRIDATTKRVLPGTYDIVLMDNIPTMQASIPKGTLAAVRIP